MSFSVRICIYCLFTGILSILFSVGDTHKLFYMLFFILYSLVFCWGWYFYVLFILFILCLYSKNRVYLLLLGFLICLYIIFVIIPIIEVEIFCYELVNFKEFISNFSGEERRLIVQRMQWKINLYKHPDFLLTAINYHFRGLPLDNYPALYVFAHLLH